MNQTLIAPIISASVPTLLIVLNRSEIGSVRKEIGELRSQQHADMLRIYELFGEHGERIRRLEALVR